MSRVQQIIRVQELSPQRKKTPLTELNSTILYIFAHVHASSRMSIHTLSGGQSHFQTVMVPTFVNKNSRTRPSKKNKGVLKKGDIYELHNIVVLSRFHVFERVTDQFTAFERLAQRLLYRKS